MITISSPDTYSVIILAGGHSTRMQQDKRTLLLGEEPVIGRILRLAEGIRGEILISANDHLKEFAPYPVIPDLSPGEGPLNGFLSAGKHIQRDIAFVLTCDMPMVDHSMLTLLAVHSLPGKYTAFIKDGIRQPFPGIVPKSLFNEIEIHYNNGVRSFKKLFDHIPIHLVNADHLKDTIHQHAFLNLNNPSDLNRAKILLNTRQHPTQSPNSYDF
jgi:molybdopterin-guanine dinucleotide biosynthesis protein A